MLPEQVAVISSLAKDALRSSTAASCCRFARVAGSSVAIQRYGVGSSTDLVLRATTASCLHAPAHLHLHARYSKQHVVEQAPERSKNALRFRPPGPITAQHSSRRPSSSHGFASTCGVMKLELVDYTDSNTEELGGA